MFISFVATADWRTSGARSFWFTKGSFLREGLASRPASRVILGRARARERERERGERERRRTEEEKG